MDQKIDLRENRKIYGKIDSFIGRQIERVIQLDAQIDE